MELAGWVVPVIVVGIIVYIVLGVAAYVFLFVINAGSDELNASTMRDIPPGEPFPNWVIVVLAILWPLLLALYGLYYLAMAFVAGKVVLTGEARRDRSVH